MQLSLLDNLFKFPVDVAHLDTLGDRVLQEINFATQVTEEFLHYSGDLLFYLLRIITLLERLFEFCSELLANERREFNTSKLFIEDALGADNLTFVLNDAYVWLLMLLTDIWAVKFLRFLRCYLHLLL